MGSLVDEAFAGTLTSESLDDYIKNDPSIINKPGGSQNHTPLIAAVIRGNLEIVELLLHNQADPNVPFNGRTPLFFATRNRIRTNQTAIVSALLKFRANVNTIFESNGNNTALTNAVFQLRDKEIVQLLIDHGADAQQKNARGLNAHELAKQVGPEMERALRPRQERQERREHFINLIVAVVMFVLAIIDNGIIEETVKGAISKIYQITGAKDVNKDVFKDLGKRIDMNDPQGGTAGQDFANQFTNPNVTSPSGSADVNTGSSDNSRPVIRNQITAPQLEKSLQDYLKDNELTMFFKPGDTFLRDLARRAAELSKRDDTIYNDPDNVTRLIRLSLYQPVIYCDDSGSMDRDKRYEYQAELVGRISRIATKILPDDCGVHLSFINYGTGSPLQSSDEVVAAMRSIRPKGGTRIGTNLRTKILDPLVHNFLDSGKRLTRPILVCSITDGCPTEEPDDTFKNAILDCHDKLFAKNYDLTAVKFLVSQVGNDPEALNFLDNLRNDLNLTDMLYCTSDRLDEKFKELKAAENRLEEWLLKTLTLPLMATI